VLPRAEMLFARDFKSGQEKLEAYDTKLMTEYLKSISDSKEVESALKKVRGQLLPYESAVSEFRRTTLQKQHAEIVEPETSSQLGKTDGSSIYLLIFLGILHD
jgi:hypothetical protein